MTFEHTPPWEQDNSSNEINLEDVKLYKGTISITAPGTTVEEVQESLDLLVKLIKRALRKSNPVADYIAEYDTSVELVGDFDLHDMLRKLGIDPEQFNGE